MIFNIDAWIFWLILFLVFLVIEALTLNVVSIWFSVGSLGALVLDVFHVSVWIQVASMIGISILGFIIFLYFVKPKMGAKNKSVATNADRIIGAEGHVTQSINTVEGTGLIKVNGQVWSAVSWDNHIIEEDSEITVLEIAGVKAVVKKKE